MNFKRLVALAIADSDPLLALHSLVSGPYRRGEGFRLTGEIVDAIHRDGRRWSRTRSLADSGRYGELVEWIRRLAPEGPVLDIGAGDGLLAQAMACLPNDYLGVDFAEETMARMQRELGGPLRRFVRGDATSYVPERRYPLIVLNDMLYYLEEPVRHAQRFASYLEPEGALLVAMFLGRNQLKILHGLHRAFVVIEQSLMVAHDGAAYVQLVLRAPAG